MIHTTAEARHVSRSTGTPQPTPTDFTRALLAIHASLLLHTRVLSQLKPADYTASPCGPVKSSIASHTRHTLDHVEAFLKAVQTGVVNFDHRERNTSVETDLLSALSALDDLRRRVHHAAINPPDTETSWVMSTIFTEGGTPAQLPTSPLREAAFVLSHTIHHHAIMGIMARHVGAVLPERFGYAPSTPPDADPQPCAR